MANGEDALIVICKPQKSHVEINARVQQPRTRIWLRARTNRHWPTGTKIAAHVLNRLRALERPSCFFVS